MVPALIGAFAGAPVLARELETGTFRFAWTQGFGRWRWALAKLVALAVVLAAAAGAFGVLVSWYYQPYFAAGNQALGLYRELPVRRPVQPARGHVPRLDAGRLRDRRPGRHAHPPGRPRDRRHPGRLRRARLRGRGVPARALPDAAGHQQPRTCPAPRGSSASGGPRTAGSPSPAIPPGSLLNQFCSSRSAREGRACRLEAFAQCLAPHGYTQWTSYQPASRFWPFQWIEGGWLLALSALLIAATVWLVQPPRRLTHPAMEPRLPQGGNRLDAELLEEQQAVRVGPVLGEHAVVDAQGVGAGEGDLTADRIG